ncbi:hypothetical protein PMAYCL1PPCAC_04798, partial [Pristionchus mayeri]
LQLGGTQVEVEGIRRTIHSPAMPRKSDSASWMMLPFVRESTDYFPESRWGDLKELLRNGDVSDDKHSTLQRIIKNSSLKEALKDIGRSGNNSTDISDAKESTRLLWKIIQLDFPDYIQRLDETSHSLEDRLRKKAYSTADIKEQEQLLRMANVASS